jgi:hypothetical protein
MIFTPLSLYGRATLGLKKNVLKKIFRGSFGAAKFLTGMLSLILRRDFFLVWTKKKFFLGSF